MSDLYQQLSNSPIGKKVVGLLGLPAPTPLRRFEEGAPLVDGPVLLGGTDGGRLRKRVQSDLEDVDVKVIDDIAFLEGGERLAALILDATGITEPAQLEDLFAFFHEPIRRMGPSGRLLVLGTPPEEAAAPEEATAQRALEGFVRSVAKELRAGGTAQLVYVAPGAEHAVSGPLRFLLSGRSAFVSGQVVRIAEPVGSATDVDDPERPLADKVAVVTGASRGIGASIAEVLSRAGAHVVCLDLPSQGAALSEVANRVGGEALQLDVTAEDAPRTLAKHLTDRHDGVDIVVHNAGITRDKTLAGMDASRWNAVIDINLASQQRIDAALLDGVLRENGRIVAVSSMSGIAGNRGQTNYATSKAGVIGRVEALAPSLRKKGITINAVAPGFIETEMTAAMPIAVREVGRRMNSLAQGGQPVDVAETIAWLAEPGSAGVHGEVLRVCGQNLLGA
jgi:3-oxoacyl-[acyl-carrier protein] reductase